MNITLNNTNKTPVQKQKTSQTRLRQLVQKSPIVKQLEHGSYNSYNEIEGVYHIYRLEAGYQRGLFDMVNNCAQNNNSVVAYFQDQSGTGIFKIFNALDNTCRTMHLYGESVVEGIEYIFNIKFTSETLPLKPSKPNVFEERMNQSRTRFEAFRSFHDHLILLDNGTALELTAATDEALKAGITHIKNVDQMFHYAKWVDTAQHPQKDGVYKWLWFEDDNLIMYSLCQIHNNENYLLHDFYFSYDKNLMNSSDCHDFDNEVLLMKLKALCRKENIGNILAGL